MKNKFLLLFMLVASIALLSACKNREQAPKEKAMEGKPEAAVPKESPPQAEPSQIPKGDAVRGSAKYAQICATCHGETGRGDGPGGITLKPKPRNLRDASYMSALSDEHLFKVIDKGGPSVGKSVFMPPWGGSLSDQDIRDIIAFIREGLCKCTYTGNESKAPY